MDGRDGSPLLYGRGIWNVKIWIGVGLLFMLLNLTGSAEVRSPLWFTELVLYGLMIFGLWANQRWALRKKLALPKRWAPAAYIFLVWLCGMLFEASLTVTGEGIGGIHPQNLPSFILAQGDYIPLAIISYLVIRKYHLSFREVFFLAGGKSLTEGLIFTGVLTAVILSPQFFLAPIVLAYYTLAYSSFIALPLLLVDEELLWQDAPPKRSHSIAYFWLLGFVLALGVRLFWGLVYSPLVSWLLHLSPDASFPVIKSPLIVLAIQKPGPHPALALDLDDTPIFKQE